jgi:hypothetical protein
MSTRNRNAGIVQELLALKVAWSGGELNVGDLVAKLDLLRARGRIPDAELVPALWAEIVERDQRLHEAFALLDLAIATLRAPSSKLRQRRMAHELRARQLRLDGLSLAAIGVRMASEEGRRDRQGNVRPYRGSVVSRWLSKGNL